MQSERKGLMKYHGYLCYNSKDFDRVKSFYELLNNSNIRLFFDKENKIPGSSFNKINDALEESQTIIIFFGKNGIGPYQEKEYAAFFSILNKEKNRSIYIVKLVKNIPYKIPSLLASYEFYEYLHDTNYDKKHIHAFTKTLIEKSCIISDLYIERPILKKYQRKLLRTTINFYEKNASMYYERWKNDIPHEAIGIFIRACKKENSKPYILDAGCGPGHHSNYLAKQGFMVTGIDLADSAISIAKQNINKTGTNFIAGDFNKLEIFFDRNIFDGVWAAGSCIHVPHESISWQLYQFLAVLKPNGILGITFQIDLPSSMDENGRFFERYKISTIEKRIQEAGYRILHCSIDYKGGSTTKGRKIKTWALFIAQAPSVKSSYLFHASQPIPS